VFNVVGRLFEVIWSCFFGIFRKRHFHANLRANVPIFDAINFFSSSPCS